MPPPASLPPPSEWPAVAGIASLGDSALAENLFSPPPQSSPLDEFNDLGWLFDLQIPLFNANSTHPVASRWPNQDEPEVPHPHHMGDNLLPAQLQPPWHPPAQRRSWAVSRRASPSRDGACSDWPEDYEPQNERVPQVDLAQFVLTRDNSSPGANATQAHALQGEHRPPLHDTCSVSADTRQSLLEFIAATGMHQGSLFCLSTPATPTFLTIPELSALLAVYFERVHPHMPFIHAPTFNSATTHPLLLLSILATALPFSSDRLNVDSAASRKLSAAFADLVRIGIVTADTASENNRSGLDYRAMLLMLTQSWLHQQNVGLGCGDKRMYQFAERNRGGLITFARRSGLLHTRHATTSLPTDAANDTPERQQQAWRHWLRQEAKVRLAWSIFVYDQQICVLLDTAPMLTPSDIKAELPRNERLWCARNPQEWIDACRALQDADLNPTWLEPTIQKLLTQHLTSKPESPQAGNCFTMLVLATVLYRLRWDMTKTRRFLLGDEEQNEELSAISLAMAPNDNHLRRIFHSAIAGLARSAERVTCTWSAAPVRHPVVADVHLLRHICILHFAAGGSFVERCVAAAGRNGLQSEQCMEARKRLSHCIQQPKDLQHARDIRSSVASAAQIVAFAMDHESSERDSLMMVFGLFHAALVLWAYTLFHDPQKHRSTCQQGLEGVCPGEDIPFCTTQAATLTQANGVDLAALHESQLRGLHLWIAGCFQSDFGLQKFHPRKVTLGSIACIESEIGEASEEEATKLLKHASLLLNTLPHGLANSFAAVLHRLADTFDNKRR